jgi:hypothetical protein
MLSVNLQTLRILVPYKTLILDTCEESRETEAPTACTSDYCLSKSIDCLPCSGQCAPDWYNVVFAAASCHKCQDWGPSFLNHYTYYFQRHNVPAPPHVANMSRFCGKCRTNHMVDLCACKVTCSVTSLRWIYVPVK